MVHQQQQHQAVFREIYQNDLGAVKARVQAADGGAAVLDTRNHAGQTPLMYAIDFCPDHTIPLLLVAHKGKHDLNTLDNHGSAALHYACNHGGLPLVQALIAAGADPAQPGGSSRSSPLIIASSNEHADVVQYLLTLPAAKATLDDIDMVNETALSTAVFSGSTLIVPILLAAGADPTLPPGRNSPLQLASRYNRLGTAAALCRLIGAAIEEPDRSRALHRARTLRDLPAKLGKARSDARCNGRVTEAEQRAAAVGAAPECLKGRVAAGTALPEVSLAASAAAAATTAGGRAAALPVGGVDEEARATVAFALDMDMDVGEGDGARAGGLPPELFVELMGYLLPAWADKGPDAAVYQPHERPPPSPLPMYHPLPPPVPPMAPQQPQLQAQQQQQQQQAAILQQLQQFQQFQQFIALQFQ